MDLLALENFRSFGERSAANIAPITLVYGPNSAGKSSLVKSLLLLKQSTLESNSGRFRYDGPYVDFGSAKAVAHRHSPAKRISVEVGLSAIDVGGRRWTVRTTFAMGVEQESDDRVLLHVRSEGFSATIEFRRAGNQHQLFRLAGATSAEAYSSFVCEIQGSSSLFSENDTDGGALSLAFEVDAMLPGRVAGRFSSPRSATISVPSDHADGRDERAWNEFATRLVNEYGRLMRGVSYLGPLRRPWSRVESVHREGRIEGVGPTGEFAVNLLYRHPDLLSRVNRSLDLLEMGYTLQVRTLRSDREEGFADVVPDYLVPMLHHEQSGVWISPADAGFGLSQLLPLLVEMELRKQSVICVEQPELHLHPRLQANVGAVLRKAVQGGNRNRFIIETHSEHLLLRLQRLIRNGLLDASSVVVVYVENQSFDHDAQRFFQSISSTMLTLRLSSTGELLDPWPGGFFDERWNELAPRRGGGSGW